MPKMENFNMHSAACGEDKPKPEKNRNAPARSKCVGQIPWPRTRRRMPADDDDGQEMATRSLSDQAKRHHHCSRNRHYQVLNSFESCNCQSGDSRRDLQRGSTVPRIECNNAFFFFFWELWITSRRMKAAGKLNADWKLSKGFFRPKEKPKFGEKLLAN